jgi:hypothetical protein
MKHREPKAKMNRPTYASRGRNRQSMAYTMKRRKKML